jgi:hypothetical protein
MQIFRVVAAEALLSSSMAAAVTISSVPGAPDPGPSAGQTLVVTFDVPAAAGYSFSGNLQTSPIHLPGHAAEPVGDTSKFGFVSTEFNPATATLSTPKLMSISFYWGSIDTYNTVDILGPGGVTLLSICGGLIPPANGDQTAAGTNRRVNFAAGAGETITGLRFGSTGVAFEFDNFAAAAVPEPAAWAMMIGGFGLVGAAARGRRNGVVTA